VPLEYERVSGPSPVASVSIAPSGSVLVQRGDSEPLRATARDAEGRTVPGRRPYWRVIGSAVAVSESGVVKGVERGGAYVVAVVDGRADTVAVVR
jgi:hypothetical protein